MLRRTSIAIRPLISIVLVILLLAASVPSVVAASLAHEAALRAGPMFQSAINGTTNGFAALKGIWWRGRSAMHQEPRPSIGVKPQPPPTNSQREARVASLRINPKGEVTLQAGQPMLFSAIPLDSQGEPIQGLASAWRRATKKLFLFRRREMPWQVSPAPQPLRPTLDL